MMMLQESVSTKYDDFTKPTRRIYKKRFEKDPNEFNRISNVNGSTSINTNYDWHRLLMTRLKPGVTGKYRTSVHNSTEHDIALPVENPRVCLRSFNDDSSMIETRSQTTMTSSGSDSPSDNSSRRESLFVKNSNSNRSNDRITSLKRRVRKIRHNQNQTSVEEITVPLESNDTDVLLVSYNAISPPTVSTRRYRPNKTGSIVPLPPIPVQKRKLANQLQLQDIKYNFYVY